MSEKIPQSNPEDAIEKRYFIPVSDQKTVIGDVNYRKQKINASRRADGPDMMVTQVEVSYETKDDDGNLIIVTKWMSDHHFTESSQRDLEEKYHKTIDRNNSKES